MEKIIQIATMPAGFLDTTAVMPWVYGLGDKGTLYRLADNTDGIPQWEIFVTKDNNK